MNTAQETTGVEAAYYAQYNVIDRWHAEAGKAMTELVKTGRPFTADDVRARVTEKPTHPNAWGGLYREWRARGLIRAVGYRKATTKSRKGSIQTVWQASNTAK